MTPIIVETRDVHLPETIAWKIKGSKLETLETSEGVLIRSIPNPILSARGILKGKGFTTKDLAEMKEEEKEHGFSEPLTNDRHFEQAGFKALLCA
jgi:hypothetical protein